MPHCSRGLELTGTASSFILWGQDQVGGQERSSRSPCPAGGGGGGGAGTREGSTLAPQPSPKGPYAKRVSFNFACKKLILHIFCMSLTVPIEPGPCASTEGKRTRPPWGGGGQPWPPTPPVSGLFLPGHSRGARGAGVPAGTRPVVTVQRAFVLGFDIFLDSMS